MHIRYTRLKNYSIESLFFKQYFNFFHFILSEVEGRRALAKRYETFPKIRNLAMIDTVISGRASSTIALDWSVGRDWTCRCKRAAGASWWVETSTSFSTTKRRRISLSRPASPGSFEERERGFPNRGHPLHRPRTPATQIARAAQELGGGGVGSIGGTSTITISPSIWTGSMRNGPLGGPKRTLPLASKRPSWQGQ